MTPETFNLAADLESQHRLLLELQADWSTRSAKELTFTGAAALVPDDAWKTFYNAVSANLQAQIDANRKQLAAL